MNRIWKANVLSAIVLSVAGFASPVSAQLASPASPLEFYGPTFGVWVLPSGVGAMDGYMNGILVDQYNQDRFLMKANVEETPSTSRSIRNGYFWGELKMQTPFPTPTPFPKYYVYGKWEAFALTGDGWFEGAIYRQLSPLGPVVQVGKLAGDFWPDFYLGKWKVSL